MYCGTLFWELVLYISGFKALIRASLAGFLLSFIFYWTLVI